MAKWKENSWKKRSGFMEGKYDVLVSTTIVKVE
jgi:transcription-repair coupling factor (superfamily II helicase)